MKNIAFYLFIFSMLSLFSFYVHADELVTTIDRDTITEEETLNITVRYTGKTINATPDFSALENTFEVLTTQQSSRTISNNGYVERYTEWALVLFPKSVGKLLIPPFTVNGQSSTAQYVTVEKAQAPPPGQAKDLFIETLVDKRSAYVQEQIHLTYRLFYAAHTRPRDLNRDELNIENARSETLPKGDYERRINHIRYGVAEFRYAVTPQTSGEIVIPPLSWTIKALPRASRQQYYQLFRLKSDEVKINVKPRPVNYPSAAVWLPAQDISIEEQWSESPERFIVGEPITRTLTLTAKGLTAEQLPKIINSRGNDAFKFFDDKPVLENKHIAQSLVGMRSESYAVVPSVAGEVTLPAIEVSWWNTLTDQLETARIAERTVTVAPSQDVNKDLSLQDAVTGDSPLARLTGGNSASVVEYKTPFWLVLSNGLLLIACLVLAYLYWGAHKTLSTFHRSKQTSLSLQKEGNTSRDKAFKALKDACSQHNPQQAREYLILWAQKRWPFLSRFTLSAITQHLNNPAMTQAMQQLESALYAQEEAPWDGSHFIKTLESACHKNESSKHAPVETLRPLYH